MSFLKGAFAAAGARGAVTSDWTPASVMSGAFMYSPDGITAESALQNSAYFGCVRAISEDIAKLPRDIYKKDEDVRKSVESHPSLNCLTRESNSIQTSYQFFRISIQNAVMYGNGFAELQFSKKTGDVIAMWPIPPGRTQIQLLESRDNIRIAYDVTLPDGTVKRLRKEQVLHIPGVGFDGIQGYPMAWFMSGALNLAKSLEEYQNLFFKQGAGLQGYVSVPDSFTEELS